jgi:hypothetical protein
MGDFNLDLKGWKEEPDWNLPGWDLYPGDSRPARDLRASPIDYILIKAPGNTRLRDDGSLTFSPFPLGLTGTGNNLTYSCCSKAGLHGDGDQATFTAQQLENTKIQSSASLRGDTV